jgi:chromosome segregation ATPase
MRKIVTFISATALMLGLLSGTAAADHYEQHSELEEALRAAQELVVEIDAEIAELEDDLRAAKVALDAAEADRDAQALVVADLEQELRDAQGDLDAAQKVLDDLIAIREACDALPTNPERNQCRNPTNPAYNAAVADVAVKTELRDDAQDAVDKEQAELDRLQDIVDDEQKKVDEIEDELAAKRVDLADAIEARDEAQAALDAWVEPVEAKHAGCKGVQNAQAQVAKNSKGKAPATLEVVADKLGC